MPTNRQFPLASHTFSVYRRNQTVMVGNNITPQAATSTTPIDTNVSILLRDLEDVVLADAHGAGYISTARFLGLTFPDIGNNLIIGDILVEDGDNPELDRLGNTVRFAVDGKSVTPMATKLHLTKLEVGV